MQPVLLLSGFGLSLAHGKLDCLILEVKQPRDPFWPMNSESVPFEGWCLSEWKTQEEHLPLVFPGPVIVLQEQGVKFYFKLVRFCFSVCYLSKTQPILTDTGGV